MQLLVGLGNPGGQYAGHRHNVGFMAVDAIVRRHGFGPWRGRFHGQVAEGVLDGAKVLVLKPETYMNESGRAVGAAALFYKLRPHEVTVFYDELDLAPGKIKVKTGGGAAGHNGIRSIDAHVGNGFKRVRIGIGHPGQKDLVSGYVLHDFAKADRVWLDPLLDGIADAVPLLAKGDDNAFMTRVALVAREGEPPRKRKDKAGDEPAAGEAPQRLQGPPIVGEPEPKGPLGGLGEALAKVFGGRKDGGG